MLFIKICRKKGRGEMDAFLPFSVFSLLQEIISGRKILEDRLLSGFLPRPESAGGHRQ